MLKSTNLIINSTEITVDDTGINGYKKRVWIDHKIQSFRKNGSISICVTRLHCGSIGIEANSDILSAVDVWGILDTQKIIQEAI